jgi:hypothetical protein
VRGKSVVTFQFDFFRANNLNSFFNPKFVAHPPLLFACSPFPCPIGTTPCTIGTGERVGCREVMG